MALGAFRRMRGDHGRCSAEPKPLTARAVDETTTTMMSTPRMSLPGASHGHSTARRFSIRDAVAVVTGTGELAEWLTGTVVGVTYGTTPQCDVRLDATGEILQHISSERLAQM